MLQATRRQGNQAELDAMRSCTLMMLGNSDPKSDWACRVRVHQDLWCPQTDGLDVVNSLNKNKPGVGVDSPATSYPLAHLIRPR